MELLYVDVTLDFERKFLEQQMVDLWRKPLDLQVELGTPWAEESALWSVHKQDAIGDTSGHQPQQRFGAALGRFRRWKSAVSRAP